MYTNYLLFPTTEEVEKYRLPKSACSCASLLLGDSKEKIVTLTHLITHKTLRNKGFTKRVLFKLCRQADEEEVIIYLSIQSGEKETTKEGLIKLYKSFDFIFFAENDDNEMFRSPKK